MLIRPVRHTDLKPILNLVSQSGFGLTNLPADSDLLARRIDGAVQLFAGSDHNHSSAAYMLVMEDPSTGEVVGTGAIIPHIGNDLPFYAYLIETHIKESLSLGIREEMECLHLLEIRDRWSEIGGLFVHPGYQGKSHGRLMSLSRFLFLEENSAFFDKEVIAEMRGVIGQDGKSPFWDGLGRHFFKMAFPRADYLSTKDKRFIAELMPRHPVYTVLLPEAARVVIGQVHPQTRPALGLLIQEGFKVTKMIDIFDGGPIVRCKATEIRTVKDSKTARFSGKLPDETDGATTAKSQSRPTSIISAGRMSSFRACLGAVKEDGHGRVRVSSAAVDRLAITAGDAIRYVLIRPEKERSP